jgi:small subunit ribosomal protein S17
MTEEEKNETEAAEEAAPEAEAPAEEAAAEEAPAEEAAAEEAPAPAAAAAAAPAEEAEPEEELGPKERRKRQRSLHRGEARPPRTAEERVQERAAERRRKAEHRRQYRARAREKRRAEPKHEPPAPEERVKGSAKVRQGVVVSDKADKTITVRIDVARRHRVYKKIVRTSNTLHVHDEQNEAHIGDTVRVIESRPLSRTKRWRLVEVLERAR